MPEPAPRSGFVAIVGRPNVGKSTLLNALLGEKLSIVSAKPHTTRHRILGILNRPGLQAAFIDTPGHARRSGKALHRAMARTYRQAVEDADLVVLVMEATGIARGDRELFDALADIRERTVLVINKIDMLKGRTPLLPLLAELEAYGFRDYVPVSALTMRNLEPLIDVIASALPEGPPLYPPEFRTDKGVAFRAAEIIREKLFEALHQEVPYGLTVEIETIEKSASGRVEINALIWIERDSHKPIVIGKGGRLLKSVGTAARHDIAALLGESVHLNLWIKVREHWSDNERELRRLGYDDA